MIKNKMFRWFIKNKTKQNICKESLQLALLPIKARVHIYVTLIEKLIYQSIIQHLIIVKNQSCKP